MTTTAHYSNFILGSENLDNLTGLLTTVKLENPTMETATAYKAYIDMLLKIEQIEQLDADFYLSVVINELEEDREFIYANIQEVNEDSITFATNGNHKVTFNNYNIIKSIQILCD